MKLKMAENSLFAVLLRSPWYVSLGIGLALGAAGWALFPEAYRIAGAGAGLPFVVIAGIALWKQMQLPSTRRVESTVQAVTAMSWPEFANAIEEAFRREGHDVKRVDAGPVDFEISKAGRTAVVGARRWKVARTGVEPLRALHAAAEAREAGESIHIAVGEVTPSAREFAAKHRTRLMGGAELVKLLGSRSPG
jgi:restriction system protein